MSDKRTFVDTNVILYLFTDNDKKKNIATSLLSPANIISTQVVNENINVCLRKLKLGKEESYAHGQSLLDTFNVVNLYPPTITNAFNLSIKYGFSYWDSLIVATALENNCEILLSEDMQDGLLVEGKMKIKNPFKGD